MKRCFDLTLAAILTILLSILLLTLTVLIKLTSKGPVIHWSERNGRNNKIFRMPKFRTMIDSTPQLATHLLKDPDSFYSPLGIFLRKSSLDELPQLFSILKGDMSFVGPRPALFNQHDLIEYRTKRDLHELTPGLTGWAQVNGRDELSIEQKVEFDLEYLERKSILFDFYILWLTLLKTLKVRNISH
tara:strand:- start:65 stop:625 length:561 start_codon:yes stop_codon:yes gene_type:complete